LAVFLALKKKPSSQPDSLALIQNQINELRQALDAKLREVQKINVGMTEKLTRLDETNKRVFDFAKQLQSLQDVLQNPKHRGVLGEYFLEVALQNVLAPGSYELQYAFSDGTKVDAVIKVKDKIIPVDSKFSLENYNKHINARDKQEKDRFAKLLRQDLKTRIDETSKYIKPAEGTVEFAFMFIPSESLYYDLLVNNVGMAADRNLINYAVSDRKVIIVSPATFMAYLQTVLQGLKMMQIEESAQEIQKAVTNLSRHLLSFDSYMKKLGSGLKTAAKSYGRAYKEFAKIDKDVFKISGEKMDIVAQEIESMEFDEEE